MKGQNLRILVGATGAEKCIASAKSCSVHIGVQTDDASTKDDAGDWSKVEVTGKSWDASAECNFEITDPISGATGITAKEIIALIGTTVHVKFQTTSNSGSNRTTTSGLTLAGNAIISDLVITSENRQTVSASVQFTGTGSLA